MGYNTYYTLNVSNAPNTVLLSDDTYNRLEEAFDHLGWFEEGSIRDSLSVCARWYNYEEDMLAFSRKFPEVLFELHGEGENNDDMWYAYFLDGKIQRCPAIITYDDFDIAKLVSE